MTNLHRETRSDRRYDSVKKSRERNVQLCCLEDDSTLERHIAVYRHMSSGNIKSWRVSLVSQHLSFSLSRKVLVAAAESTRLLTRGARARNARVNTISHRPHAITRLSLRAFQRRQVSASRPGRDHRSFCFCLSLTLLIYHSIFRFPSFNFPHVVVLRYTRKFFQSETIFIVNGRSQCKVERKISSQRSSRAFDLLAMLKRLIWFKKMRDIFFSFDRVSWRFHKILTSIFVATPNNSFTQLIF